MVIFNSDCRMAIKKVAAKRALDRIVRPFLRGASGRIANARPHARRPGASANAHPCSQPVFPCSAPDNSLFLRAGNFQRKVRIFSALLPAKRPPNRAIRSKFPVNSLKTGKAGDRRPPSKYASASHARVRAHNARETCLMVVLRRGAYQSSMNGCSRARA